MFYVVSGLVSYVRSYLAIYLELEIITTFVCG
jgi:hypothetical protein